MDEALAQTLAALSLAVRLSLPACGAALAVALGMAALQALTRLSEPAITALPRALATLLALGAAAGFMASELLAYTGALLRALPELVR